MASIIRKNNYLRLARIEDIHLAIFAIDCMTKLLASRPYFNFSSNMANFLIPFLDHKDSKVRNIVEKCFTQVFKEDMRGDLSLMVSFCII